MFRPIHWFGCFLFFVASILILITTISAPVINDISLLRVDLSQNTSSITFGTFGYCVLDSAQGGDWCTPRSIGYSASDEVYHAEGTTYSEAASNTANGLTRVMVLHPVACALTFIAFLIASGAGIIGSLLGVIVTFVAWVITVIVMATDFTAFGIIKNNINDDTSTKSVAYFGTGLWCLLAAFVLQFVGMVLVFFTCCTDRRKRRQQRGVVEPKNDYGVQGGRRWGRWRR